MELKYIKPPAKAGGSAIPDCGTIHLTELCPTLNKLTKELCFPVNLNNYLLGSTGKREYSGDIDLVLDTKYYSGNSKVFHQTLIDLYGNDNTARNGTMAHLRYKIQNYNKSHSKLPLRNGYVQIDFNFGDAEWERMYHYSPGEISEYKGGHRNLGIVAVCDIIGVIISNELDFYDRPMTKVRWKWGTKGLIRVNRHSVNNEFGECMKQQVDTNLEGPYYTAKDISKILFPEDGTDKDIESLETVIEAVKRNYGMVDQERVWKSMARHFHDWKKGRDFIYPLEIQRYFDEIL